MSLIGEALKKAHLEAVRQDGSSARLAHTPGVAQYRQPHPAGRRWWTTALVASNILLALIVAAAVVWKTSGSTESSASAPPGATSNATGAAPPTVIAAASSPPGERPGLSATATPAEAAVTATSSREALARHEPAAVVAPTLSSTPAQKEPAVAETPAPRSTAPRTVDGLVAGQTYMRSVPVPGGSELVLSGMSVVGERGVALINSRMVRAGDRVGPFVVGTIADRRVALDYKGITVYVKMP